MTVLKAFTRILRYLGEALGIFIAVQLGQFVAAIAGAFLYTALSTGRADAAGVSAWMAVPLSYYALTRISFYPAFAFVAAMAYPWRWAPYLNFAVLLAAILFVASLKAPYLLGTPFVAAMVIPGGAAGVLIYRMLAKAALTPPPPTP